ncbi:response regulator [Insolitispirillum peregrinum]|uniref:response regulator n=1 Tax=Insolitispirillum peregrinum TaxID=80876 RepID=UPI003609AC24
MSKVVLSVDDSASMRQMVSFALEGAGYTVRTAVDGQDALDVLAKGPVDLILTDLNMPRMDGLTLIKQVRTLPSCRFVPIIFLTTESEDSKKAEAKASGATGWIVKPFQQDQLLAVVKRFLG